jgi:predicted glycoside hydrolase/deacetylase ChbG (UPF0249 family)
VTHVDGHRHLHLLPGAWEGVVRAAVALGGVPVRVSREYDPPEAAPRARLKRAVIDAAATRALRRERPPVAPLHFIGSTLRGDARYFARLRSRIAALPDGRSELMTHPGYASGGLPGGDPYDDGREVELCVLTSPALRDLLASEAIVLDNFRARLTTQARSPLSVA